MTSDKPSPMTSTTRAAAPTDRPPPMRRRAHSDAPPKDVEPLMPAFGDVVDGKYRVEERIGIGGMGVVVAARHLQLKQKVALKFLLPEGLRKKGVKERFMREARAAVAIASEHIARVIDVGALPSGIPFIVMEHLEGTDLSRLLDDRGAFTPEEAAGYVLEACEAIAEAHALGIVHRDLKPSNLFLARRPDGSSIVKVLDFGIAKSSSDDAFSAELTQTNQSMGSPQYMSPEQVRDSKNVDARTDIWALGVVLYELVAARAPFVAESLPALSAMIVADDVPPLATFCPDVPEAFAEVVHRCLAKNPRDRYPNLAELALALKAFAPSHDRSVDRISLVVDPASRPLASTSDASTEKASSRRARPSSSSDARRTPRKHPPPALATTMHEGVESSTELPGPARRRPLWPALVGIAALLAVGAFFLVRSMSKRTDDPPARPIASATNPAASDAAPAVVASSTVASASSVAEPVASTIADPPASSASAAPSARPTARPVTVVTPLASAKPKSSAPSTAPDPYGDRK